MIAADYPMLAVEEALALVLAAAAPLPPQRVPAAEALGLVLAAPVQAAQPFPPFAASVKDGYAVVAADGPGLYPLAGRVAAGQAGRVALAPGQVAYITTGAPMPPGADAVVQVEDTQRDGAVVRILRAVHPGEDVRPVGFDMAAGAVVLAAGERLDAVALGLLATVGVTDVRVHPRPRVGVLSTGNELAALGAPLAAGAIYDSNGPMLRAAAAQAGAQVVDLGIGRDDAHTLRAQLAHGLETCDLLISSGGVSMGEHDLIKQLLAELGTVHFGRLRMKPGKPCTFATVPAPVADRPPRLCFGLPGNPVSSLVTFSLLALPAIRRLAGWPQPTLPRVQAVLGAPLKLDRTRPEYHRARLAWDATLNGGAGGWLAASTGIQASSRLLSMRGANALLELPQGEGALAAGTVVWALVVA